MKCNVTSRGVALCSISVVLCSVLSFFLGCSTQKNTSLTRKVHAIKANYNTYFNGKQSYLDGVETQINGNADNHLETLPLLIIGNDATLSIGKSQFERAIEKCQKSIKQHSITKRPTWNSNKPKSAKDRIWLSQREYNPFLYKAWFLMGESQLRMGDYMEAVSTFTHIQKTYFSSPDIVARARMLEALCYAEQDWLYEAEDLVARAQNDSFPDNLKYLKAQVLADCKIRNGDYEDAIPHVLDVLKKQKGNNEKARLCFLLGQLYHSIGEDELAYKYFGKVYSKNPPYQLAFNARIQQTEVMSAKDSKNMIKKLRRMAKSEKNKEYLDQVYYALGNIYLAKGDTVSAIANYKNGVEKSMRNSPEKGILCLRLGRLYWDTEKFAGAKECYTSALGMLDKDRKDYKEIDRRSKILDELYPYASAVELQDSLQRLARMDSVERMKVIDLIIEEVKKKEKEEAAKADAVRNPQSRQDGRSTQGGVTSRRPGNRQEAVWYFYNPQALSAGKTEFVRKWGNRALADDWRRKNITVLADEPADSIASDSLLVDSLGNVITASHDSMASELADTTLTDAERKRLEKEEEYRNDPHRPEFYLKDIPLTDEQMEASNAALVDGLYNAAIIYKDQMENFPLAERTFKRVLNEFPDYEHGGELFYNLFQLYSRVGETDSAQVYKERMQTEFADNPHTVLISDPYFEFKARYGAHVEDSIYQATYNDYVEGVYDSVIMNADYIAKEYPDGLNRARFMFLSTMSKLNLGQREDFLTGMREIVEKYPKSTVSELAGLYVKGLKEGRLLASGTMDHGSLWSRRIGLLNEGDSIGGDTAFVADKEIPFVFVVAYERDSIDTNALLFEIANYNFSNFTVRNFDMNIEKGDGIDMFQVSGFKNYEEAYVYIHRLHNDPEMLQVMEGLRMFIISEDNLGKLMRGLSFQDYFQFYDEHFDPVGKRQVDVEMLDQPTDIPSAEDLPDEESEEVEESYQAEEESYLF